MPTQQDELARALLGLSKCYLDVYRITGWEECREYAVKFLRIVEGMGGSESNLNGVKGE